MATKTPIKTKKTPTVKKAVVKKQPENNVFTWTDDLKQQAHDALLAKYNRHEPCRKNTLLVMYNKDGSATTRGIAKQVYTHNVL